MAWLKGQSSRFLILSALLAVILFGYFLSNQWRAEPAADREPANREVTINGQIWQAEVAATPSAQYVGLSGRDRIDDNKGMLFVFPDGQEREFVMRNMGFPLDIVFINQRRIIKIFSNLTPEGETPKAVYASGQPADMVLEINAGQAAQYHLQPGQPIIIK